VLTRIGTRRPWAGIINAAEQIRTAAPSEGIAMLSKVKTLSGYKLQARDGEIGSVKGSVIDDASWEIRYLVVATKNWWPGKKVLVSPLWIDRVEWSASKVFINLSRETIQGSPEYTEDALLTRDYEIGLHRHYSRKGYWADDLVAA
jgi:hypothetical protein